MKYFWLFLLLNHGLFADDKITYTFKEMQKHKEKCLEKMMEHSSDPAYQLGRACLTISGRDTDKIPKVSGAGEIFYDEIDGAYQLMHNGIKIGLHSYYDAEWLTDVIRALKGHHEPQEEKCFYEILPYIPEGGTMIELGSYWAYYSLWFASEIKNAKNYCMEPDPKRLEVGRKNFALNGRTAHFYRGYAGVVRDGEPDINGAPFISIDDFLEREDINHVNILHADIQGAEYEMLLSCVNHLDKIDYFVVSTHDHEIAHSPCLKFFQDRGFLILAEHTASQSLSGDGLIVAKRPGVRGPNFIKIQKH